MNFKTYLTEDASSRTRPISLDIVKDLVTTRCSQFLTTNTVFFRGSKNIYKAALIEPKKFHRKSSTKSINTDISYNMHNYLMSILPSWSQYPKRTDSVIFTPNQDTAEHYAEEEQGGYSGERQAAGCVLTVYPYNEAKIGCCKSSDMWSFNAFPFLGKRIRPTEFESVNITSFCGSINKLLNFYFHRNGLQTKSLVRYDESEEILIIALNKFDTLNKSKNVFVDVPSEKFDDYIGSIDLDVYNDLKKHYNGSIWTYLDEILNPIANQFRLLQINDLTKMNNVFSAWANELWTDSPCVLLNVDYGDKI